MWGGSLTRSGRGLDAPRRPEALLLQPRALAPGHGTTHVSTRGCRQVLRPHTPADSGLPAQAQGGGGGTGRKLLQERADAAFTTAVLRGVLGSILQTGKLRPAETGFPVQCTGRREEPSCSLRSHTQGATCTGAPSPLPCPRAPPPATPVGVEAGLLRTGAGWRAHRAQWPGRSSEAGEGQSLEGTGPRVDAGWGARQRPNYPEAELAQRACGNRGSDGVGCLSGPRR